MPDSIAPIIDISTSEAVATEIADKFYSLEHIQQVLNTSLEFMSTQPVTLPYFEELDIETWTQKPKQLGVYLIDSVEGRELNLEARDKDYATNILSYPSDLPAAIIGLMPTLPLGELVICHAVVVREATEQKKTVAQHISHLLIHGILHLLGFDHELGQAEQDEMESFEIDILAGLALPNPYL